MGTQGLHPPFAPHLWPWFNKVMNRKVVERGFTIVELLIVIVVIAILASVILLTYNGIRAQAATAKRDSDMAMLLKAVLVARNNTGQSLGQITGSYWSVGACTSAANNPDGLEPRLLATSHFCWTRYYAVLANLGNAAGMNLDGLRSGDTRGNPYSFDENEGEAGDFCRTDSRVKYFTGSGVTVADGPAVPKYFASC